MLQTGLMVTRDLSHQTVAVKAGLETLEAFPKFPVDLNEIRKELRGAFDAGYIVERQYDEATRLIEDELEPAIQSYQDRHAAMQDLIDAAKRAAEEQVPVLKQGLADEQQHFRELSTMITGLSREISHIMYQARMPLPLGSKSGQAMVCLVQERLEGRATQAEGKTRKEMLRLEDDPAPMPPHTSSIGLGRLPLWLWWPLRIFLTVLPTMLVAICGSLAFHLPCLPSIVVAALVIESIYSLALPSLASLSTAQSKAIRMVGLVGFAFIVVLAGSQAIWISSVLARHGHPISAWLMGVVSLLGYISLGGILLLRAVRQAEYEDERQAWERRQAEFSLLRTRVDRRVQELCAEPYIEKAFDLAFKHDEALAEMGRIGCAIEETRNQLERPVPYRLPVQEANVLIDSLRMVIATYDWVSRVLAP